MQRKVLPPIGVSHLGPNRAHNVGAVPPAPTLCKPPAREKPSSLSSASLTLPVCTWRQVSRTEARGKGFNSAHARARKWEWCAPVYFDFPGQRG